jgi:hypothetical protein
MTRKERMTGENNPRWNGGISEYTNHAELKRARLEILKKTKGKCEICGKIAKIVHHKDGDKSNHSLDNLIAVCQDCHTALHAGDYKLSHIQQGKPSKYGLIYGFNLKEMAEIFEVVPSTILYWLKNPQKELWLKTKLEKYQIAEDRK